MNVKKVGLTLGALVGFFHLVWSILIAFGWAQGYLNFVFNLHSLNNPFIVESFNLGRSLILVILTSVIGYVVGVIFATIFNKINN